MHLVGAFVAGVRPGHDHGYAAHAGSLRRFSASAPRETGEPNDFLGKAENILKPETHARVERRIPPLRGSTRDGVRVLQRLSMLIDHRVPSASGITAGILSHGKQRLTAPTSPRD